MSHLKEEEMLNVLAERHEGHDWESHLHSADQTQQSMSSVLTTTWPRHFQATDRQTNKQAGITCSYNLEDEPLQQNT